MTKLCRIATLVAAGMALGIFAVLPAVAGDNDDEDWDHHHHHGRHDDVERWRLVHDRRRWRDINRRRPVDDGRRRGRHDIDRRRCLVDVVPVVMLIPAAPMVMVVVPILVVVVARYGRQDGKDSKRHPGGEQGGDSAQFRHGFPVDPRHY